MKNALYTADEGLIKVTYANLGGQNERGGYPVAVLELALSKVGKKFEII